MTPETRKAIIVPKLMKMAKMVYDI